MQKIKVAWLFGGRSTEHEVSVVTALQAYEHLDKEKYVVIPIYTDKNGVFYTSNKLLNIKNYANLNSLLLGATKITFGQKGSQVGIYCEGILKKFIPLDLAFPLYHGSFGEDGCIQGVFEINQIPYVGFNVAASAIAMDKVISKHLFKSLGLPIVEGVGLKRIDWLSQPKDCLKTLKQALKYPLFIKPATLGSTIGTNKAIDDDSLQFALDVAFTYADKVLVEQLIENPKEVNCAVLGYEKVQVSVCEMPVRKDAVLSYEDKYLRGGKGSKGKGMASLSRLIPAPISANLMKQIQEACLKVFASLDGCGVARIDFFVDPSKDKYWINEVNSPPGSLAFYLWEKTGQGLEYKELLDIMIQDGLKRASNQAKTQYIFDSPLLEQMAKQAV